MQKSKLMRMFALPLAAIPLSVFAKTNYTVQGLVNKINTELLNPAIALLFVLATLLFFWGIVRYVIGSQGDQTSLDQGKQLMIWGIIGMSIMASAWGIVKAICSFFGTC